MPTKDLIQRSDNTRVNVGTAELPKWKAPFVPDYFRGQQEYNKGNYTDPHARAYAEKTSGKVESVSPEFELIGGLGLKGATKLFTKPLPKAREIVSKDAYHGVPMPNPKKGDYTYGGVNYLQSRVEDGAVRRLGLNPEDPIVKGVFSLNPLNNSNPTHRKYIENLLKNESEETKDIMLNDSFQAFETQGNSLITYNPNKLSQIRFDNDLNHERDHILNYISKAIDKRPKMKEIPTLEEFRIKMYQRGFTNDKYIDGVYNYLTEYNGEELVARGTQLKDAMRFTKADQELAPGDLDFLDKNWDRRPDYNNDMDAFFTIISGNHENATKYFNKWSMGLMPALIGINKINKNENNKEKGKSVY